MPRTMQRPPATRVERTDSLARRRPVGLQGCVVVAVTVGAIAVLHILGHVGLLLFGVAAAGVVACLLVVATGVRANLRSELIEQLRHALVPTIGDLPATLSAASWVGWFEVGYPRVLRVRYLPGVRDDSLDWHRSLKETVERRLLVEASVAKADRRRCRLVLKLRPSTEVEADPVAERAILVISELFGAAAKAEVDFDANQALKSVRVSHEMRTRVATASNRMRIERIFSAMLPGRWRARWDLTNDAVTFEVRPKLPQRITHEPEALTDETRYQIPIAVDEDGDLVRWNLKGSGPHWMVIGRTGTGKTVAINGGVMEFCRRGWPVWIVDPKRIEFMGMRNWPNVQVVATSVADQLATIRAGHDLMEERYARIEAGADESDFEPLALVLDEFRNFHRLVTAWYQSVKVRGMPSKCPVFDWIAAIAEKGRSAGIHIILGTQRPDADFMTGSMRDNFDTRTSLGPLSPQGAQMLWDSPYLGVAVPRKIRGRGTAINEDEVVSEVQIPWTPDPRRAFRANDAVDLQILENLRPAKADHPPLEVDFGPQISTEDEIGEWERVLRAQLVPVTGERPRSVGPVVPSPAGSASEGFARADHEVDEDQPVGLEPADGDGYEMETSVRAERVAPGDLVQIDETLDAWAVVEAVEEDLLEEDQLVIEWRSLDDDESGTLSLAQTETVLARHPEEDTQETEEE